LTIGGGEQTYNLGCFVVSADWVAAASDEVVANVMQTQFAFYAKLVNTESLPIELETTGALSPEIIEGNKAKLLKLGIIAG
jgi:hypothetical protein